MCVYVYVHMCMCIVCVSNSVYEHAYTRVINTMHMFHKCSGCTQTYTRIINIRMKNTREFIYASSSHKSTYNTRYIYICVYIYIYTHTQQTKHEVSGCVDYLLDNRHRDPYEDMGTRLMYETRYARKAPTFEPVPKRR